MCSLPHFINYPHSLHEKAAAFISQTPALARQGQPLARGAKGDNVHRGEPPAMEPGNISHVDLVREVPLCDGHALRHDLTGPQSADAVKRGGIGETSYAVKKRTQC